MNPTDAPLWLLHQERFEIEGHTGPDDGKQQAKAKKLPPGNVFKGTSKRLRIYIAAKIL